MSNSSLGVLRSSGHVPAAVQALVRGIMWVFALGGAFVVIAAGVAGYLLGYSHGSADSRAQWNAVFDELRDFDNREAPRGPGT